MTNEDLKLHIAGLIPAVAFEESAEWLTITIDAKEWQQASRLLRDTPSLDFDYLFCLTGIDWKTHLSIVAHLTSTSMRHIVVLKANLDRDAATIDSLSLIWKTAEFHEREIYDLLGVRFLGHPDLRRLFMTDDYKGWPLRKDFEDPVNMIRL